MPVLWLDFETASTADLELVGTWKYAQDPSTRVLMLAYAWGDEEVQIWCPHEGPMPRDLYDGITDPYQTLCGWYCQFERLTLKFVLKIETEIEQWIDPMVICRYLSMPASLDKAGEILKISEKKDPKGKKLLQMFSSPLTPGGNLTLFGVEEAFFRDHNTNPREFEELKQYCLQDIRAERAIYNWIKKFDLPDQEWNHYYRDQRINDRGIYTDPVLLQGASIIVEKEKAVLTERMKNLTGLANPNSNSQILGWVKDHKYPFNSLEKKWVKRALEGEGETDTEGLEILKLRSQLSKSSTAKFEAFRNAVNPDGRVRHLFSFMGAARSGRWSGGGAGVGLGGVSIQPHNLIKPAKDIENKMDRALELLKAADYDTIKKEFEYPLDVAAAAIRPILCAAPEHKFLIADLAAIESRVAAWVSDCDSLLEVFRQGRDPYLAFAAQMDGHRTYEEMEAEYKSGNKLARNNAKAPVLGAIFGLGPGEITKDSEGNVVKTGLLGYAASMGIEITPEFAIRAISVFRNSYSEIVDFWYALHRAFTTVVEQQAVVEVGPITLEMRGNILCLWLPSGRALHYINPVVYWEEAISKKGNPYKKAVLWYDGVNQKTRQWEKVETRGAKLTENLVQAIARDILANGLKNAEDRGLLPVAHIHDEVICSPREDSGLGVQDLVDCLIEPPEWGRDMLLGASGFTSLYYRKD